MSKLFYDLLYSLKEVAEMENCPEVVKEIDGIIKNGLNEGCPENGQRPAVARPYPE